MSRNKLGREPLSRKALSSEQYHRDLSSVLEAADREVHQLLAKEYDRQQNTLQLIAAENQCSRAVLAALGSVVQNKTTEGFAGARFHGGCEVVDCLETLAIRRAREVFKARYANVQPHSGTGANQIVITALLEKGGRILSQAMDQGGHVSHGAPAPFAGSSRSSTTASARTPPAGLRRHPGAGPALPPRLLICGGHSAYARTIDFARFRAIADEVGAYLMADISHISGLVAAGAHPSPVDHAHFTTTSTYKPGGPRGGLILMGRDFETPFRIADRGLRISGDSPVQSEIRNPKSEISRTMPLWERIEKNTFPGFQGTPRLKTRAKAVFQEMLGRVPRLVIRDRERQNLAKNFMGYYVLTGGTDNHMPWSTWRTSAPTRSVAGNS
jgi:glycine hydroxymethyltransferase